MHPSNTRKKAQGAKSATPDDLSPPRQLQQSIEKLSECFIIKILPGEVRTSDDGFRRSRMYNRWVDAALKKRLKTIKLIFQKSVVGKPGVGDGWMTMAEW
jgi:hypothetical protein